MYALPKGTNSISGQPQAVQTRRLEDKGSDRYVRKRKAAICILRIGLQPSGVQHQSQV